MRFKHNKSRQAGGRVIEVQRNLLSEEGVGKRILRMEMPGYVARFSQEEVAMLRGVR